VRDSPATGQAALLLGEQMAKQLYNPGIGGERASSTQERHAQVARRPPSPLVLWLALPIHCKMIQTHCNAIQTFLQLNSNNSTTCDVFIYLAVATFRDISRHMATYGGI
jgi:hypothetical protein